VSYFIVVGVYATYSSKCPSSHSLLQETSYNPYYTLTAQQLCIGSHSHKVTLQYCLWDFLRDLGEEAVGGAEIVKAFSHNARNDRECPTSKISNIARAMAWWIAKDAVSLTVFKVTKISLSMSSSTDTSISPLISLLFSLKHKGFSKYSSSSYLLALKSHPQWQKK
jgi:nucleolar MIF4G domain-containing protein 1